MLIRVRVKTGSKHEGILQKGADRMEISLKERPVRNEANKKLVMVLASHFSVPVGKVKIISGHRRPSKIIEVPEGSLLANLKLINT